MTDVKKNDVMVIRAKRTNTGVELYFQSTIIAEWVKDRALASGSSLISGSTIDESFTGLSFYRLINFNRLSGDLISYANSSNGLLGCAQLGEGFTVVLTGLVTRDTVQGILDNVRDTAVKTYRNYIAPYTIEIKVTTNTVD